MPCMPTSRRRQADPAGSRSSTGSTTSSTTSTICTSRTGRWSSSTWTPTRWRKRCSARPSKCSIRSTRAPNAPPGRRQARAGRRNPCRHLPGAGPTRTTSATRSGSGGARRGARLRRLDRALDPDPAAGSRLAVGSRREDPRRRLDHVQGPLGPAREEIQQDRSGRTRSDSGRSRSAGRRTWSATAAPPFRARPRGLDASAFFCSGMTSASDLLDAIYASKWAVLAALSSWWSSRARRDADALGPALLRPLEQRRAAGQILRVSFGVSGSTGGRCPWSAFSCSRSPSSGRLRFTCSSISASLRICGRTRP